MLPEDLKIQSYLVRRHLASKWRGSRRVAANGRTTWLTLIWIEEAALGLSCNHITYEMISYVLLLFPR